jgi:DNA-binding response OmpR family regulator
MYIALYPESPSASLTGALIGAGYQPVPIADVADAGRKEPPGGWSAAVVELGDRPDLAVTVAGKIREEYDLPVLLVVDRTLTTDLDNRAGFDDFVLTPVDQAELRIRLSRLGVAEIEDTDDPVLRHDDLELNTATYQASPTSPTWSTNYSVSSSRTQTVCGVASRCFQKSGATTISVDREQSMST